MQRTYKSNYTTSIYAYIFSESISRLSKKSKKLLDEAMKSGSVDVAIVICIVLGQPGVGKTCLKYLLIDSRPPHLRTSTICAETPVRVEIRRLTHSAFQALRGTWKEVMDEGFLDTVARMILVSEPAESQIFSEQAAGVIGSQSSQDNTKKTSTKSGENFLSRIVKWITKSNKEESSPKEAAAGVDASISDACERAMKKIMQELVDRISKLKLENEEGQVLSLANPAEQLLRCKWVYFSDCGGQPEFHELLPLFVRHISCALCVTRLTDKLDGIQDAEYYEEGQPLGEPQRCQLSTKDTIKCLVNTTQSYSTQEKPPRMVLVGTHLDKLEEKINEQAIPPSDPELRSDPAAPDCVQAEASEEIETLEEKNQQLREMLEPEFSQQLVYSSPDIKQLLFPLNTFEPTERDKAVAQEIRNAVEASGAMEKKIPTWWYVMERLLQQLAKELGRGVLSRAECVRMAHLLNIKEDSLDAALEYFDALNVIKYNPKVLRNVVFIDSQIPLDKGSELIRRCYLLRRPHSASSIAAVDSMWRHFRDHGVISDDCLAHFPRHYEPGIFTKEDLCEVFKSHLILAEIPPPSWVKDPVKAKQKYYVMPALLVTLSEEELERFRVHSPVAATLLVRFPGGSRRAGVFCCFVTHLIRQCGWQLIIDENYQEPLYRNCAKLSLLTSPPCTITLIDSNSCIEVHVDISAPAPMSECAKHFPELRQSIVNGIKAACVVLHYHATEPEVAIYCPHTSDSSRSSSKHDVKRHTAKLTKDKKYWRCDLVPRLSGVLNNRHKIWFGSAECKYEIILVI